MHESKKAFILTFIIFFIQSVSCSENNTPTKLPDTVKSISICKVSTQSLGERIRVFGIFDGFGYSNNSRIVTIKTSNPCDSEEIGLVFAELLNQEEKNKLYETMPGRMITIEGTIHKIEQESFIELKDVIVEKKYF